MSVRILDRRWKWQYGEISGRYNIREKEEEYLIDPDTEKKPRQLATLLLAAMGEVGYSVDELPNDNRPQKHWVSANPANELYQLCDSLGCRVVLGLDNRVRLRRVGSGASLPVLGIEISDSVGIDAQARPDSIKVVCGPTRYQARFFLEAVGKDVDGRIKFLDDLSYRPDDGWGAANVDGDFDDVRDESRCAAQKLAILSVFKWYRIEAPAVEHSVSRQCD